MTTGNFSIRPMTRGEVDLAVGWAAEQGWNPGLTDAECFFATDAQGFLLGLLDNEPVAMVSAVRYESSYGFMGFYIVKPEVRNQGYGESLWDAGLKYLEGRNVGLDSVRPDLVSAKKPEFKPAYINFRFRWVKDSQLPVSPEIAPLGDIPFRDTLAYDREVFAFDRETFLKLWITRPGTVALGVKKASGLGGYGVIRPCREGFKIGPIFADDTDTAEALFQALTRDVGMGASVFLDTPQRNPGAVGIAEKYGMTEVFRTTRMYNRGELVLPLDKWFGITTFELG